jgi:large subunit ribosomal protein L15
MKKIIGKSEKPAISPKIKLRPKTLPKISRTNQEKENLQTQMFGLHNLKAPVGAHKKKKLLGRGSGSGHGKTSTRGSKGQTSRAGRHFYLGFEGGQSPLIRRMPKRGFTGKIGNDFQIVNIRDLNKIKEPNITLELLEKKGLIKDRGKPVKILGEGEIKNPVNVQAHAFSKKASQEIAKKGGKIEVLQ